MVRPLKINQVMFTSLKLNHIIKWMIPAMVSLLLGCSSTMEVSKTYAPEVESDIEYTIIYYVHADSDYQFTDTSGNKIRDNSTVITTAIMVAEQAVSGEVFIFHQKPNKKLLGLFPRKLSRFYYFRNGVEVSNTRYRYTDPSEKFLSSEASLFKQHRGNVNSKTMFLYFGHELPEVSKPGYHQSLPFIAVDMNTFSSGLGGFNQKQTHFELIVLSTCNNGTPEAILKLLPFAKVLLASPQNLHLSHIDSRSMNLLESEPHISPLLLAKTMAEETFKRLKAQTHSTITLSVFDFNEIGKYREELYDFSISQQSSQRNIMAYDNYDCSGVGSFDSKIFGQGVTTWYREARFGRRTHNNIHSGWGCKPVAE